MKKLIMLLACGFVLVGCKLPIKFQSPKKEIITISEEQARQMVIEKIKNSKKYKEQKGEHLEEIETIILQCPSCWIFRYEFRIPNDKNLEESKVGQVRVEVFDGKIIDIVFEQQEIQKILGGDKDEYGCLPSAGYTWCEVKNRCIRAWEESCEIKSDNQVSVANSASENCLQNGGQLELKNSPQGEFGVCVFDDNRQCEEWALLRGKCPIGGRKITGYVTDAARYCVLTGNVYENSKGEIKDGEEEQGICYFDDETICDVWEFYNAKCHKGEDNGVFTILKKIKNETGILFSRIKDIEFGWRVVSNDGKGIETIKIQGKGIKIPNTEASIMDLKTFFDAYGFSVDRKNIGASKLTGIVGHKKNNIICLVTGITRADKYGIPLKPLRHDIAVQCGKLDSDVVIPNMKLKTEN